VWQEAGIKPHLLERYLTSNDPDFETKAADVIGMYLSPPQHPTAILRRRKKLFRRSIASTRSRR
jgi:hypothetical protein